MEATNYWYRSEWQGRGSAHIHGVIWIKNAPNMDTLDWDNLEAVEKAKQFFEKYVSAMNPRSKVDIRNFQHRAPTEDPCLLNTTEISSTDPLVDYEELVNHVQRHT